MALYFNYIVFAPRMHPLNTPNEGHRRTLVALKGACLVRLGDVRLNWLPLSSAPHFSSNRPTFSTGPLSPPTPASGLEAELLKKLHRALGSHWLLVCSLSEPSSDNQMLAPYPLCLSIALDSAL